MEKAYTNIPKEKFEFAYKGEYLHDEKLQTKSRSYFQDAFIRFKKNKSSVVAAGIICLLVIFAIVAPIISPYSVYDRNTTYQKLPPFIPSIAAKEWGIFDGATVRDGQNQVQMDNFAAIAQETGFDPLIKIEGITSVTEKYRGQDRTVDYYTVSVNAYYSIGVKKMTLSYEEYARIQAWQDENQIQVILPWVEKSDAYADAYSDAIKALLPLADSLDKALEFSPDDEGIKALCKLLTDTFAKIGVTAIESDGKEFAL